MNVRLFRMLAFASLILVTFSSCQDDEQGEEYGIFVVNNNGLSANVDGTIVDESLFDFQDMMADHPDIDTLNLIYIEGSDVSTTDDSDFALDLGRSVYQAGVHTHLVDNGLVSSGGTDLFAAGVTTSIGSNPTVGVHSWAGGWDGNPDGTAWDIRFDENHPEHVRYITYFEDIGFTTQEAEDFYFFTIRAASAEDIYDMTIAEINQYLIR